ncbi:MAG TPA: tetratricopeptide repeat protein [Thermoanaerobaculia bacterium]|nr:tetratricopeptide repeat protein [Thermoanaerobaculia bacterium]
MVESLSESHPDMEALARWLSGRMEHDEVLRSIAPHLFSSCPVCQQTAAQLAKKLDEVGHWDEMVAAVEAREAEDLLAELDRMPFDEQHCAVRDRDELHTWGLCQLLLSRSRREALEDPGRAVDAAELAVQIALQLGPAYDTAWVLDLQARAYGCLGNARRVLGELRSAEDAFRLAEGQKALSGTGNLRIEAELLVLKAALRRDQRRFGEALGLIDRAITIYREDPAARDNHLAGRAYLNKAYTLLEMGKPAQAIPHLRRAAAMVTPEREPRLDLVLHHNLLGSLVQTHLLDEAEALLPSVHALARKLGSDLDLIRLSWHEARIRIHRGHFDLAEQLLREVQKQFLERRMGYDAALVCLDLAILYTQTSRTGALKELAAEVLPILEDRAIHREAIASLLLFQRACEEERLTLALAHHLANHLSHERRLPTI